MNPENPSSDASSTYEEHLMGSDKDHSGHSRDHEPQGDFEITKIAEIQRMNIDQLNQFGKKIDSKVKGLTKEFMDLANGLGLEFVAEIDNKEYEHKNGEGDMTWKRIGSALL